MGPPRKPLRWLRAVPLWIGLAALVLYLAYPQRALWGDGPFYEDMLNSGRLLYHRFLLLPLATALQWIVSPVVEVDGEMALRLLSAVSGAVGVGIAYLVGLEVFKRRRPALAVAALLAFTPSYWAFATATEVHALHAACAALLFLGLIRALGVEEGRPLSASLLGGAALTPASHLTGIFAVVPAAYALLASGARRELVLRPLVAGFGLVGVVYLGMYLLEGSGLRTYLEMVDAHGQRPVWQEIGDRIARVSGEMLLYAVPASTLLPAGLRILFRSARRWAWLVVAWLAVWIVGAFPVNVREFGSYFVPTFLPQAVVGFLAFLHFASSVPRALATVVLAVLPGVVHELVAGPASMPPETLGLVVYGLVATTFTVLAGSHAPGRKRLPMALPIAALVLSCATVLPRFSEDPVRDRIREVAAFTGRDAYILLFTGNSSSYKQWVRFFPEPGAPPDRVRHFTAFMRVTGGEPPTVDDVNVKLALLRALIDSELAVGHSVYLAGDAGMAMDFPLDIYQNILSRTDISQPVDPAQERYRMTAAAGGPAGIFRIAPH